MVCGRCISAVQQVFSELGITPIHVELGVVKTSSVLTKEQLRQLDVVLAETGFERIDDRKKKLINQIKSFVIDHIHHQKNEGQKINWSTLLQQNLSYDYKYISTLFSSVEGISIEQYIIKQKIERVKELLVYDELSLSQIADELEYSSVAHLSAQFKKVTGLTPSAFKLQHPKRTPLDLV